MSGKIRIYANYGEISPYSGIDKIISELQQVQAAAQSGEWTELTVDATSDQSGDWLISGYRWETDREYALRMKQLEKAKEIKKKQKVVEEQNEKKLYEKLKKKYGDK